MARARSRAVQWEAMAEPMKRQALSDFRLACQLQEQIGRDPRYACTGVALLAQTAEKLIKAWLLSRKERGISWRLRWMEHDVLAILDVNGRPRRRRQWLQGQLSGGTFRELQRLLRLVPRAGFARNVEYPYLAGALPTAPCDGFTEFDYSLYRTAVGHLVRLLEPIVN